MPLFVNILIFFLFFLANKMFRVFGLNRRIGLLIVYYLFLLYAQRYNFHVSVVFFSSLFHRLAYLFIIRSFEKWFSNKESDIEYSRRNVKWNTNGSISFAKKNKNQQQLMCRRQMFIIFKQQRSYHQMQITFSSSIN